MQPCCSKDVKSEPTDDSINTEPADGSIKPEPAETTIKIENETNPVTNIASFIESDEEDEDLLNYEPGDRVITISGTWLNRDEKMDEEENEHEISIQNFIKREFDDEITRRSIGVNTDDAETDDNNDSNFNNLEETSTDEESEPKTYNCRLCDAEFISKITLYTHLQRGHKEEKKCRNCKVQYRTWRELERHEPYCPRAYGLIHARTSPPTPRRQPEPKRPYKCRLCNRRYETYKHLFNHQVKRCKKRYIRAQWVVKI